MVKSDPTTRRTYILAKRFQTVKRIFLLPEYRDVRLGKNGAKRLRGWLGLSIILLTGLPASAETPSANVILVTIDTLRADRLGCYGNRSIPTPTADRLARDGVIFRRAIAQVPLTLPSHVAILTGTYPMWNGVEDLTTAGLGPAGDLQSRTR